MVDVADDETTEVPPGWVTYIVTDDEGCSGEAACVRRQPSVATRADALTIYNIELQVGRRECISVLESAGYVDAAEVLQGIVDEMQVWIDSHPLEPAP